MNKMFEILKDNNDKLSIKRAIVAALILLLIVVVIAHVFFNKTISDHIYDGLIDAVIWSMGFIGSEKFVDAIPNYMNGRNNKNQPTTTPSVFDTPPV